MTQDRIPVMIIPEGRDFRRLELIETLKIDRGWHPGADRILRSADLVESSPWHTPPRAT